MKKLLAVLTMLAIVATMVVGCASGSSGTPSATGTLKVNVTDAPPSENVTSILVTVSSVEVHRAAAGETANMSMNADISPIFMTSDNTTANTTGNTTSGSTTIGTPATAAEWINIPLDGSSVTFDLLNIQGIEHYIGAANLTAGHYTQVRLHISKIEVGLNGAAPVAATLPSSVLKVVRSFDITSGQTTSLLFDFDAAKMVTVTGNGHVIVKPVVKLTVTPPATQ
jgi:hypothetical protein